MEKSDRVASIQCHHIYTPQVTHMHSRNTLKAMEKYDVVAEAPSHFKFRLQCGRHRMIYLQDTSDEERKQKVVREVGYETPQAGHLHVCSGLVHSHAELS